MAPAAKANYRSFDAQARLLRAVVAAHPEVKWNYKDIAQCYGSDITSDALNHRFRHLRAEAVIISEARKQDLDMKELKMDGLPKTQGAVEKNNIAKYFGASTGDGIGFQFRSIKADANAMKSAVDAGQNPNTVPVDGPAGSTKTINTPRATPTKKGTPASRKRKAPVKEENLDSENEESTASLSQDWSEMDMDTPSKKKAKSNGVQKTPVRGAKAKTVMVVKPVDDSNSNSEGDGTVNPAAISLFGDPSTSAFKAGASDGYIGGGMNNFSYNYDGEI